VTPTGTATASPTSTPALGGHVRYYTGGLPVPEVDLALSGATADTAVTDAAGDFGFTADGSESTLQPSKQGGRNGAITALDATYVLQFVAGSRTLDPDQRLAAEVTGNGTVTALDATRILQFAAGQLSRFAVADLCRSDWIFRPEPLRVPGQTLIEPQIGDEECVMGAITYGALTPPTAGQDFVAILFGDVTGNWPAPVATSSEKGLPPPTPTRPPTVAPGERSR
jgi:hypothetical protein